MKLAVFVNTRSASIVVLGSGRVYKQDPVQIGIRRLTPVTDSIAIRIALFGVRVR